MPLPPGQIIHNRYRIERLLGLGGFSAVYVAWDLNLLAPVALKESLEPTPATEKQFRSEATLLFRLRHPNLPIVHDCFSIPGQALYLTMDYIEGESLEQKLAHLGHRSPLPVQQVLAWIGPICDALEYLHRQSPPVIHRDIKPSNIIIRSDGMPFLVDFGISKLFDPGQQTTLAAQALTPGYAPPEQYGHRGTDERSDIYSLGATIYHLLTGQPPPAAMDVSSGGVPPPNPPEALNPDVPPRVGQAVMRSMQIHREQRWSSAGEFKRALLGAPPPSTAPLAWLPDSQASAGPADVLVVPASSMGRAADKARGAGKDRAARRPVRRGEKERRRTQVVWLFGGLTLLTLLAVGGLALLFGWQSGRDAAVTRTVEARHMGTAGPLEAAGWNTLTPWVTTPQVSLRAISPSPTARSSPQPSSTRSPTPVTPSPTGTHDPLRPPTTAKPGEAWTRPADGMPMRYIPAGEFRMGSTGDDRYAQTDETPRRAVTLDAYWIDQTEVTNAMFGRFVAATGYVTQVESQKDGQIFDPPNNNWREARMANWQHPAGYQSDLSGLDMYPVVLVTWQDAVQYCQWAGGRLPSEAEWEKAARGTDGRTYPWGNDFKGARLNFCDRNCPLDSSNDNVDDGWGTAAPVGSYPGGVSPYGVLDLAGNVWEWVSDWYQNSYAGLADNNPFGPQGGSERVVRGGSWAETAIEARGAYRFSYPPGAARDNLGFRCVRQ